MKGRILCFCRYLLIISDTCWSQSYTFLVRKHCTVLKQIKESHSFISWLYSWTHPKPLPHPPFLWWDFRLLQVNIRSFGSGSLRRDLFYFTFMTIYLAQISKRERKQREMKKQNKTEEWAKEKKKERNREKVSFAILSSLIFSLFFFNFHPLKLSFWKLWWCSLIWGKLCQRS